MVCDCAIERDLHRSRILKPSDVGMAVHAALVLMLWSRRRRKGSFGPRNGRIWDGWLYSMACEFVRTCSGLCESI